MSKKLFKEKKYNLGIVESYKKSKEQIDTAIIGSFDVKGMTVENMVSQNKTQYSEAVWKQPTAFGRGGKFLDEQGKLKPSTLFGSVDHPLDNRAELLLQEAAIAWHDVRRNQDGSWDGSAHILNNPQGRIVRTFLDYAKEVGGGDLLGVSSRALGESQLVEANGEQVEAIVPESFELMSFDFVYNPSFQTATATLKESKKSRKSLVESVRNLAKDDNAHAEVYKDFAKKLESVNEEITDMTKETNKEIKVEGNSLKSVRTKYLKELRQEEKRLHDALHELKMMSDEEFAETNSGNRSKLMKVVEEEYDEVTNELERLEQEQEGTMVEDTMEEKPAVEDTVEEEANMKKESNEKQETIEIKDYEEKLTPPQTDEEVSEIVEEATETVEEAVEGTAVMEDEDLTDEEMEDLVDSAEEMADELNDEETDEEAGEEDEEMEVELDAEPTIESLSQEIMELKEILQELRDFLMPVEDAELELDDEAEEELEELADDMDEPEEDGEEADDLNLDLSDEDLDELSDEELEYLASLDL